MNDYRATASTVNEYTEIENAPTLHEMATKLNQLLKGTADELKSVIMTLFGQDIAAPQLNEIKCLTDEMRDMLDMAVYIGEMAKQIRSKV